MSAGIDDGHGTVTLGREPAVEGDRRPVVEQRAPVAPQDPPLRPAPPPGEAAAAPHEPLAPGDGQPSADAPGEQIAGVPVLKGLILYSAVFAFAAVYIYFIVNIVEAKAGTAPSFDGTLVSAAAALAGVLGSAFALAIGVTTSSGETNSALHAALAAPDAGRARSALSQLRRVLSVAPANVAITYITHQNETPPTIKALAVVFAGYVIALVTTAYGVKAKGGNAG
jgi:hypothetical protein